MLVAQAILPVQERPHPSASCRMELTACHPERIPALFISRRISAGARRSEGSAFCGTIRIVGESKVGIPGKAARPSSLKYRYRFRDCQTNPQELSRTPPPRRARANSASATNLQPATSELPKSIRSPRAPYSPPETAPAPRHSRADRNVRSHAKPLPLHDPLPCAGRTCIPHRQGRMSRSAP